MPLGWQFRGLLGWCVGIAVYLLLAWRLRVRYKSRCIRKRAQAQDEPRVVIFLLMLLETLACVAAIIVMRQQCRDLPGLPRTPHIGLTILDIKGLQLSAVPVIGQSAQRTTASMRSPQS